ncbi:tyrosine-type recombinase/integrase [Streptococcus suis]|uniref:Site-specific integrase n=1 Tax=Streptococcus suis TaxID=1307 RepID=A0A7Y6VEQ0_STRSU|nr:site-specific integrase [Streptococcus suis]ANM47524.1 integrase/recombinase [Streptococcus phage phiZJ20091101-2]MBS0708227.1 site-specific integrase [Streptococcus suis]MBS0714818.1 site-specific integrase [Streptococcus suis]MBS0716785.1 site-specific integrase [Streptococcus suis]MBS0720976.1 site-specific integrase [Streptococcus suis]
MRIKDKIKKNGQKVYYASVYLGVDQLTGKKARTTVTATTQKGVRVKARDAINAFAANGYTVKDKPTITTYKELVKVWWDSYKNTVKPNTRQSMDGLVRVHLLPVFGDYKLSKLTTPIIQQQVNKWADKANTGQKGAFTNYSLLHNMNKRILKYGVSMQVITYNPANDVIVPRKQQKEKAGVKYLDNKELKQFLDYLDTLDQSNYENLFDVVLYKTLLATGCRIGEALALEWSDIDLDNGIASINKTLNRFQEINSPKSSAGYRDIPIDNATLLMLKQYKNRQQVQSWQLGRSETVVFSVFTEKYAYACNLRQRLNKHFKAAGVTNVSFHGFRHTHTTMMLYAQVSPKDVQYRLGHSNLMMTENVYWHTNQENAKKAVSNYETAINSL